MSTRKRKIFEIFPFGYNPDKDMPKSRKSKWQAKKLSAKMPDSQIQVTVRVFNQAETRI